MQYITIAILYTALFIGMSAILEDNRKKFLIKLSISSIILILSLCLAVYTFFNPIKI